ncbi:uncharacterized protein [Physcomitrium patens]|uniref:uncharacterized protein n=1 Tax=Physcomitrium patens TaxID=3218 RepID=UPI003CCDF6E8
MRRERVMLVFKSSSVRAFGVGVLECRDLMISIRTKCVFGVCTVSEPHENKRPFFSLHMDMADRKHGSWNLITSCEVHRSCGRPMAEVERSVSVFFGCRVEDASVTLSSSGWEEMVCES